MDNTLLEKALLEAGRDHETTIARLCRVNDQLHKLKDCGLDLITDAYGLHTFHRQIERKDLPAIRKAFGPIRVKSKEVPYDYYEAQEINVIVTPKDPDVDISFSYRKHYAGNGKCKVVEIPTTYKQLVCTAE